jgi:hypothetical protein
VRVEIETRFGNILVHIAGAGRGPVPGAVPAELRAASEEGAACAGGPAEVEGAVR